MIVDTSFVLDVIDDVDEAVTKEQELEAEAVPLVIPAMTVLELYIGVGDVANTLEERQRGEGVLRSYPLVAMTPSVARRAGRILGERIGEPTEDEGPGNGTGDAAVAATALERDKPILAGVSHFNTACRTTGTRKTVNQLSRNGADAGDVTPGTGPFATVTWGFTVWEKPQLNATRARIVSTMKRRPSSPRRRELLRRHRETDSPAGSRTTCRAGPPSPAEAI